MTSAHRIHRHKKAPGLLVIHKSPRGSKEHGSASSPHEWRHDLDPRYVQGHFEGRKLAGDRMLSFRIMIARDTELAHLVLQRSSLKSEPFCGATSAGYSSGRAFQSIEDCLPLCLLERGR